MFNEANSVENFIRDLLCSTPAATRIMTVREQATSAYTPIWQYIPATQLRRKETDVLIEADLREALMRLNPSIAAQPARADEVLHRLHTIIASVPSEGLVQANEKFASWLLGEHTMPFGPNNEHTTVRLIDFTPMADNRFVLTTQLTYRNPEKRFDLVLLVNGIPLIVGETKTPVRPAITWVDGAKDLHDDYEKSVPAFFVPNVFSFATEGKYYRFGSIHMPLDLWAPWRASEERLIGLAELESAVLSMLRPEVVLDILQYFTVFATDKQHRKIKIICRYQQYQAANQIVERVVAGRIKKGLIWHFQGSGKSLLMVFAAQKLRMQPELKNPTVLIVVDRVDLDTQISATFNATDVPNMVAAGKREQLETLLRTGSRKIILTTVYKFAEMQKDTDTRSNIIVMVDEAHRTQEGDLGTIMHAALPNAFFFGLTGTPINKRDRNTFWNFGADEDKQRYMSRYTFQESLHDHATLPLHFEPRPVNLRIDKAAIDATFASKIGKHSKDDQAQIAAQAAKFDVLVKAPERVKAVVADIVQHYQQKVEPNGFKAMIVTVDRDACVQYRNELERLAPGTSDIIMTVSRGEQVYQQYDYKKDEEEKILDRFRDPRDPLKFLIVTARLLTGFDAPILQVMYLDKLIQEHNLLQAICRTNRPYPNKTHGLIVDYLNIFDNVAAAFKFDEKSMQNVITALTELKDGLPAAVEKCLAHFPGVDRTISGYPGLQAAQDRLPDNNKRDAFAEDYLALAKLWEALSPDESLYPYIDDYRWLSEVYESVKSDSGHGALLWHSLGAKTIELIHENVHVEAIRNDLEILVMDADVLSELLNLHDPNQVKDFEIKITTRLRRHRDNPKFIELGERLDKLRERHEQGLLLGIEYMKQLLEIMKELIEAENAIDPIVEENKGKATLQELFSTALSDPASVEQLVNDVDTVVKYARFDGWQETNAGDRDIKKALRRTLLRYKLHTNQELFENAYRCIARYY